MRQDQRQFEFAIEVFVRGHSAVRSRTHPYDVDRVGPAWVMRDALCKNARDYRKEEWVASGVEPAELSRVAKGHTRGHYFLCDLLAAADNLNLEISSVRTTPGSHSQAALLRPLPPSIRGSRLINAGRGWARVIAATYLAVFLRSALVTTSG
jgi:hypothetical protein